MLTNECPCGQCNGDGPDPFGTPCYVPHPDNPALRCGLTNDHPEEVPHGAWWEPIGSNIQEGGPFR